MTKKHPLLPSEFCENHDNCINPLCVERRDKLTAELNQQEEEIEDIKKQLAEKDKQITEMQNCENCANRDGLFISNSICDKYKSSNNWEMKE